MGAAVALIGKHDIGSISPFALLRIIAHFTHIVGIAEGDIANALPNRLNLSAIITLWLAR